ncbi:MAG: C25 family cysteine peptidase [bacterium]
MVCKTKLLRGIVLGVLALALALPATAEVISFDDCWGNAGFNVVETDAIGLELVFSVPEFRLEEFDLDGEMMQNVIMPGVILPNNAGAPNLPGLGRFIAVPEGAVAEFELIDYRVEIFQNVNVVPAFEIPRDTYDGPLNYSKDMEIYSSDANYPAEPILVSEPTQMRGVDVVNIGITPFQYNPVTKELTVFKDMRVRINYYGGSGQFGEDRLRNRFWEPLLETHLLNYSNLPQVDFNKSLGQTDEDNVEYLIIIPDDPVFAAWADTLKQWRNEQGIVTGITTLTEIGGNSSTLIENYINNAVATWDPAPVAVLLLSDFESSADLYGITSPTWNGYCASDNIYADIDNNDLPDLAIARICAQNYQQLNTMITKMLDYERYPYTDPGFYQNPVIAGGWQTERWFILCCEVIYGYLANVHDKTPVREYAIYSGTPGSVWSSNANTYMIVDYFGPTGLGYIPNDPSHLTDWGGNATRLNNDLNQGAFILQHRDHGGVTGWGEPDYQISDLSGLTNDMYPYVFSINCLTGQYDGSTECFSEAFHRMEHGALGVTCASDVSYSFVNDTFVWGIYDLMWPDFDPGYGSDLIGSTNLNPCFGMASGKYYLAASNWPYNPSNKDETYHLFHHFGDAFMTLYSEIPQNLTVLHADALLGGFGEFTVTADAGALIGLSVNGEYLAAANATGGPVTLSFEALTPGQVMRVTVTNPNYYRYMAEVNVIPPSGPYVIAESVDVVDALGWNPNGQLDYDETSKLSLTVQNIGVEVALNVSVTITTDDPLLTIIDGSENYGNIAASSSATVAEGFEVAADAATPDDHIFVIDVTAISGLETWESSFAVTGHAPVITLDRLEFDDPTGNNNGWLDPGETADMDVFVTNEGSSPGMLLAGDLTSLDPLLTVNGATGDFGTINPGGAASAMFNVAASASAPQEHLADVSMAISGDHSFAAALDFQIMIGNLLYDPTGPDSYGYLAYDPFNAPENPQYEWIEISADSGGPGTRFPFTADDQTFTVPLPFDFQYYGETFDSLSVGANGWLAPGTETNDDYSNSGIPNADGPARMIAPYWEDLSPARPNAGGVWFWSDVANHLYIVEWNHIEQYAPTGSFETFQVILYDPAYYGTSTNDGRIKFQYKTMSTAATTNEGTVGIENSTQTIGIQYFFDGAWDMHAHHIENEFAILFSTPTSTPQMNIELTYVSGSPVPAGGGNLYFEVFVENLSGVPVNFDGWLEVAYQGGAPTTVALRTFSNFLPTWTINRPDMFFPCPSTYAGGNYTMAGKVGSHPNTAWDESSFPWVKTGAYSGGFQPFVVEGMPNPFVIDGEEEQVVIAVPEEFALGQNYPNPFNPSTTISFALPEAANVKLTVFNINGQIIATLVDGFRSAANHEVVWDASGISSGLYFYKLEAGNYSSVKKMVLMK